MKLVANKDSSPKRLKRQEGWLDLKPRSKREMLFVAEQFRRILTPEMEKFFDGLIHQGREYKAPSEEQLVSFYSISAELKQKVRR
jgi:hypothetical protein